MGTVGSDGISAAIAAAALLPDSHEIMAEMAWDEDTAMYFFLIATLDVGFVTITKGRV